ncbi:MAG TPA: hypothetical protein VJ810_37240 [Blastocatellia bacterium]|nr:hypothetical protein [Blastocatellia bacterium]
MNSAKQILVILACLLLYAPLVVAQEPQPATISRDALSRDSREVTIIIQQQQLRFAAPASAQEVRLEVFNQAGEMVYDSGLVSGAELSWTLRNLSGDAVPSGLYAYTLTVKDMNSETPTLRRGNLIVERGRDREPQTDRVWVTSQSAVGAEAAINGGEMTVSSGPETSVVGARIGRAAAARSTLTQNFFGTPGRIPMFVGGDLLADSVINQDFNNRIGIGTAIPGTALLTVAGQIHTTSGGIKFPNGTVQTTSAANALFQVFHDATLAGSGTETSLLGVAIPLTLTGPVNNGNGVITVTNTAAGGPAIFAVGGVANAMIGGGSGLLALGGTGFSTSPGGVGIVGFGGSATSSSGGTGGSLIGGVSTAGNGGDGLFAVGALGVGMGKKGGRGIVAIPGGGAGGATAGLAGEFLGDVEISGNLSKGGGSFRIDHPLDPANKYLYHSFVESPDMMNVYNGNITTDGNGEAIVTLPDYFGALNRDFRYQLTVIGQFAQAIVASKISDNRFTIKTDRPGVEVSWQVTGIRQDAYANKHRIPVEEAKPERERGYYLHPQAFNQPEEKSVEWARNPEMMRESKGRRQ